VLGCWNVKVLTKYEFEMGKITKFEDLRCWMAARALVKVVYTFSEEGKLAKDFGTKDQIKRAALSVMNNIAEGFGRYSRKEFIRYLEISQSSATEVLSITYVLEDLKLTSIQNILEVRTKADEARILSLAMIRYLKTRGITPKPNPSTP
jgi:four helix bundle protein